MPTCYITISDELLKLDDESCFSIRDIVADELSSKARMLDRHHIALRLQYARRLHMLGDIELEIFCQRFVRRMISRDTRAQLISARVSALLRKDCATWINMMGVGYSRVTIDGQSFFSDKASEARPSKPSE